MEMPIILGGLYCTCRSKIPGLRWRNMDLENNTFDVSKQLPFKVPPKTKVIEEMVPPKSNGQKLPITVLAHPLSLKQFAMQKTRQIKEQRNEALTAVSFYQFLYRFIVSRGIWSSFTKKAH